MELRRRQLFAKSAEISTIVFDNLKSGPANIIGDVNQGVFADILSKWRRCLCKKSNEREMSISYLQNDNSNFYEDGTPAILTGAEGDVMVRKPRFWYKHQFVLVTPKIPGAILTNTSGWIVQLDGTYLSPKRLPYEIYEGRIDFNVPEGITELTVELKSSNSPYDILYCGKLDDFNVNSSNYAGSVSGSKGGNYPFYEWHSTTITIPLTPGNHFIIFKYDTDREGPRGLDLVSIKFLELNDRSGKFSYSISETKVDDTWIESPESLIGAYKLSADFKSISGIVPTQNANIDLLISGVGGRGIGYKITDYEQHCMICLMFYSKYGTKDSVGILGPDKVTTSAAMIKPVGSTNSLGNYDTTPSTAWGSLYNSFIGIEGVFGGVAEGFPDVTIEASIATINRLDGSNTSLNMFYDESKCKEIYASLGPYFDTIAMERVQYNEGYYTNDFFEGNTMGGKKLLARGITNQSYISLGTLNATFRKGMHNTLLGSRLAFRGVIKEATNVSIFKAIPITN